MSEPIPFPASPWALKTIPEAIDAIQRSPHGTFGKIASITYSADWVFVRTPFGMGKFNLHAWNKATERQS